MMGLNPISFTSLRDAVITFSSFLCSGMPVGSGFFGGVSMGMPSEFGWGAEGGVFSDSCRLSFLVS